jgi:hypothetical protein
MITLSFREFYLFQQIANFLYDVTIHKDCVIVKGDSDLLEEIGY